MTKRVQFLSFLCTLALMFGLATLGAHANSQQQSPQQPGAYPSQQPGQEPSAGHLPQPPAPDTQAQPAPGAIQTFTGVITKSGDKYVLKDDASGMTYDIDHQEIVKKYEGRKIRVKGTLDPNGKLIHMQ